MPKYQPEPMKAWNWFILAIFVVALLAGFVYLIWNYPFVLIIIVFALVIAVPTLYLLGKEQLEEEKKHFAALAKSRETESIDTFARYFNLRQVDTWIIRAVYEGLHDYMDPEFHDFPIRPTDHIINDLHIDDEDLGINIVKAIAHRTGRSLENTKDNPYYQKEPFVENFVYFLNHQPKVETSQPIHLKAV